MVAKSFSFGLLGFPLSSPGFGTNLAVFCFLLTTAAMSAKGYQLLAGVFFFFSPSPTVPNFRGVLSTIGTSIYSWFSTPFRAAQPVEPAQEEQAENHEEKKVSVMETDFLYFSFFKYESVMKIYC